MKIEVGKYYKCRNGSKVRLFKSEGRNRDKWPFFHDMGQGQYHAISIEGKSCLNLDEYDIIAPWHEEGLKHDTGKPIAGIMFEDFPNALSGVCDVATFGANKYKRSSWKTVSDAHQRYSDALARHLLAKGKGEVNDPESGLSHSYHIAWNALAIAELEALNAR